jgi:chromosomal replication initiator protein
MVKEIRRILKQQFEEEDLQRWFDPLDISLNDSQVDVSFPHTFFMNMFIKTYKHHFENAVAKCFDNKGNIKYCVSNHNNKNKNQSIQQEITTDLKENNVKCDIDFASFIVNHKNYFPFASAQEIASKKETIYNPFVLYGKSGSGKTHLCKAIHNALQKRTPTKTFFWGTLSQFHQQVNAPFGKQKILDTEALIIDDFHELESITNFQYDFLSIFNAFHDANKQIVLATSKRIQEMSSLEPGLKSRLGWGLMVTLKRPDLDVRLQFIRQTCEQRHIDLSAEQMLTLAQHFSDFRSLQGCLLKILAFQNLISPQMAQEDFINILKGLDAQANTELTHEMIIAVVADHLGVPSSKMLSSTRKHDIVLARQAAMYLCRKLLNYSFPHIGSIFGGKDHSTVMYACRKMESLRDEKPEIRHQLDTLSKKCRETQQNRAGQSHQNHPF